MRVSGLVRPCARRKLYNLPPTRTLISFPSRRLLATGHALKDLGLAHTHHHLDIHRQSRPFATTSLYRARHLDLPGMSSFNAEITPDEEAKLWKSVPATETVPAHFVYDASLQKSESDDREYRVIRLENGLEALLVHDATTDKSAASMDVAVGHLSDPVCFCLTCVTNLPLTNHTG